MLEISFRGRGGQGVVMASQMLGMAFFKAGMYPQCYSLFGGERRGAPVVSFLRVDKEKILLKCEIKYPDEIVFFDSSLIDLDAVPTMMRKGGKILINADRAENKLAKLPGFSPGFIDATSIAEDLGLSHTINTILLGAYCRFTGNVPVKHVLEAVKEMVPNKVNDNLRAVEKGYENVDF